MSDHVRQTEPFRWEGIEVRPYKQEGTHFSGVTRQVLFEGGDGLACQLRYFEIAPGGWSSLERHQHAHVVMVVRGRARVLVGDRIVDAGHARSGAGAVPHLAPVPAGARMRRSASSAWWTASGTCRNGRTPRRWLNCGEIRRSRGSSGSDPVIRTR